MPCWSSGDPSNPIHSESKSSWLSFLQRPDQILRPDQPDQWFWLIIKNINAESVVFTLLCLFRLFFRSIPNLGLWQKTMTLFAGWVDQPGIFLLLDKPRRSHRQVIIFHLQIKLQSSQFLAIVRVVFFWFLFVHTVLEFRLPVPPSVVNFKLVAVIYKESEKYVDLIKECCSQLGRLQIRRNQLQRLQDDRRGQTRGDIPADCLILIESYWNNNHQQYLKQ